ncbi:MAG TPA: LCP family protein [Gaiellaceae bacterium]|nr:LCP family protein [Gaiellaceae bacterium]
MKLRVGAYTGAMSAGGKRAAAGALSLVLPGAGQLALGARRRGAVLLGLTALLLLALGVAAAWWPETVDRRLVALVLAFNLALLALRLFAVVDAARGARAVVVAALAALVAAPHVAAGYVAVRGYGTLEQVFADAEPTDVLAHDGIFLARAGVRGELAPDRRVRLRPPPRLDPVEGAPLEASAEMLARAEATQRPWTTILLLGTDEGPGNWGARTDTIIVAALEHGTGRAAAFGIPRNLVQVPLGPQGKPFREPLNALYAARGGGTAGASAVKQAVSRLLGVRVDYAALVNLLGFAELVDALGGVEILVKERLVDEVTRPAWGEPKPKIDVRPGELRRLYGREALAYVRSRKDSSDYTRMARQRCFLSALASQVDPVRVLRSFNALARTVEENVTTDVPLSRVPSLVRLATGVDPKQTLTVTFGPQYFFGRRKADRHPVPHLGRMQRLVRQAILTPDALRTRGGAKTTAATC